MRKRIICFATAAVSLFALCSCSGESGKSYNDMTYEELSQYVELGDYLNLDVKLDYYEVTELELNNVIKNDFASYISEVNITQREIREGDIVTIDYTATIDGEEFEGGKAEDLDVTIGSKTFTYAENALIGGHLNDVVEFEGTYTEGDDVDESLIGKTAVFKATIKEITAVLLPTMTNDLVYQVTGYTSYDEYVEGLRMEMRTYYDDLARDTAERSLWAQVCTGSKFIKYPKDKFKAAKQEYTDYYEDIAASFNVTLDEMLENYLKISKDTYEQNANEHAANVVYEDIVLFLVVKKAGITYTDEQYDKFAQEYVDQLIEDSIKEKEKENEGSDYETYMSQLQGEDASSSESDVDVITSVKELEARYGKAYVEQVVLYDVVLDYLFDHANVTYSDYFPEDQKP